MSDFSNVNTVQDLINLNQETQEQETDQLFDEVLDKGPAYGIEMAVKILSALHDFHVRGTQTYIEDDKADFAAQWGHDVARLEIAIDAIRDIQL